MERCMQTRAQCRQTSRLVPFVAIVLAVLAGALAAPSALTTDAVHGDTRKPASTDPPIDLSNLADRSVWHQVNAKPYRISSVLNVLCDAPGPARVDEERKRNPHASTVVTVYVNETGREAMFSPTPMVFPRGSVIVKRKFDGMSDETKALLSTVMLKREAGYNPDAGDWEFAVVAADSREVVDRGTLANCIACHTPQRENDFVFRSYLER